MGIKRETVLIANDNFTNSSAVIHLKNDIYNAIEKAVWPQGEVA